MPTQSKGICVEGGGIILPAHGRGPLQFIIYLLALMWCFLGVAIVADVFMGAIERITSKKVLKWIDKKKKFSPVVVWNPTVANLTLMALGSSAPEILLNVIELFGREFYSGDLGPSTIVGSAAFNLLCIIAVCISALPDGESRKIKELSVYVVTASFSIFAYLWLLIVLLLTTPHVVTPVEGISTFLLFPVLVVLAFMADRGYFTKMETPSMGSSKLTLRHLDKEQLAELTTAIKHKHSNATEEQIAKLIEIEYGDKHTMATRRIEATRGLTGGRRLKRLSKHGPPEKSGSFWSRKVTPAFDAEAPKIEDKEETAKCIVGFERERIAVLENAGHAVLKVTREGDDTAAFNIKFKTTEHTATAVSDYEHVEGTLEFAKGDIAREISVKICDDVCFEDDEEFFVDLYDLQVLEGEVELCVTRATVVIIDDDLPGVLSFEAEQSHVVDGPDQQHEIKVDRKKGSTGTITCKYRTVEGTGQVGLDFEAAEGTLEFKEGCLAQSITVNIKARGRYNCKDYFQVIISDPTGSAKMDLETDGGALECIHTVFITPNVEERPAIDRIMSSLLVKWDKAKVGHSNWRDQFRDAIYVNGAADEDDDENGDGATVMDHVMHVITLPWKLLIACIPPTDFMGGWICFVCSLLMIGLVTAFIGDLAGLLGCTLTIHDQVTAITFVALGTSLPDTFASKTAAMQDSHADASVGNVTGSNSVNVFLGLGMPWTMGSLYWWGMGATADWKAKYADDVDIDAAFRASGAFIVKAGGLSFSVGVFSSCALICIFVLALRRKYCGGELGGRKRTQYASSALLVCLWFLYVGTSSWYSMSQEG